MIQAIGSTVIGGVLLALIFFLAKEFVFPFPNLSGLWNFVEHTAKTSYRPYENMKMTYHALLGQEGPVVYGSGEKVYSASDNKNEEYTGAARVRIEIRGYLTKRYFRPSILEIYYLEKGKLRESSTIHNLRIRSKKELRGAFTSTIADSTGTVVWARGPRESKAGPDS